MKKKLISYSCIIHCVLTMTYTPNPLKQYIHINNTQKFTTHLTKKICYLNYKDQHINGVQSNSHCLF